MLFQKLADENADVDPDDGQRAPFVAKALTALAGYLRSGVKEIGVEGRSRARGRLPAPRGARSSATRTRSSSSPRSICRRRHDRGRQARHALSVGADRRGYPGAQAYPRRPAVARPVRARRTSGAPWRSSRMAVENAPAHERMWIEDIYQNIFCGASQGTRSQADGIVAKWRQMFALPARPSDRMGLGGRDLQLSRKCGDGELIDIQRRGAGGKEPVQSEPRQRRARRPCRAARLDLGCEMRASARGKLVSLRCSAVAAHRLIAHPADAHAAIRGSTLSVSKVNERRLKGAAIR